MENTSHSYLSSEMYESIIRFQEARIEALEKRNNLLEHLRSEAIKDSEAIIRAQSNTIDWINDRIFNQ
jgi:hypothetical protein